MVSESNGTPSQICVPPAPFRTRHGVIGPSLDLGVEERHFIPFVELFVTNPLDELVGELVLDDADGRSHEFVGIVQRHRALAVFLPSDAQIVVERIGEVVRENEIVPGIVRRIEIDYLHAAEMRPVDDLQRFKGFAFDEGVLGLGEIDAFIWVGNKRRARGCLEHSGGITPPDPRERKPLQAVFDLLAE